MNTELLKIADELVEYTKDGCRPHFAQCEGWSSRIRAELAKAGEPVAWWNGIRETDHDNEAFGPSVSWRGENSSHDIPLFDGWNPHSALMQELERYRAAVPATPSVDRASVERVIADIRGEAEFEKSHRATGLDHEDLTKWADELQRALEGGR